MLASLLWLIGYCDRTSRGLHFPFGAQAACSESLSWTPTGDLARQFEPTLAGRLGVAPSQWGGAASGSLRLSFVSRSGPRDDRPAQMARARWLQVQVTVTVPDRDPGRRASASDRRPRESPFSVAGVDYPSRGSGIGDRGSNWGGPAPDTSSAWCSGS